MKILIVDCTAEELRANRTVMDSLTEALSGFTRSLVGVNLSPESLAKLTEEDDEEEEESKEEED